MQIFSTPSFNSPVFLPKIYAGKFLNVRMAGLRFFFLICAILVYGLIGTPTPDQLGPSEIVIALFILGAVLHPHLGGVVSIGYSRSGTWILMGRITLFFGVSVPLISGTIHGNAPITMARDLIWFGFIMLPVLLAPMWCVKSHIDWYRWLAGAALLSGFVMAVREFLRLAGAGFLPFFEPLSALAYLGNSPLVACAAIFMICSALLRIINPDKKADYLYALFLILAAFIPVCVMILTQQRAFIGAVSFCTMLTLIYLFGRLPSQGKVMLLVIGAGALYLIWPFLQGAGALFLSKTRQVGLNMRLEEWGAVWSYITLNPFRMLFGAGWGAVYPSPAVGEMSVSFTHGALSFALLKTGICGAAIFTAYYFALGQRVLRFFWNEKNIQARIWGMALIFPFMIDVFLYASFKSLDFGILLLLMAFIPGVNSYKNAPDLASATKSH